MESNIQEDTCWSVPWAVVRVLCLWPGVLKSHYLHRRAHRIQVFLCPCHLFPLARLCFTYRYSGLCCPVQSWVSVNWLAICLCELTWGICVSVWCTYITSGTCTLSCLGFEVYRLEAFTGSTQTQPAFTAIPQTQLAFTAYDSNDAARHSLPASRIQSHNREVGYPVLAFTAMWYGIHCSWV